MKRQLAYLSFTLFFSVLFGQQLFAQGSLHPFSTDYCTGYPEGTFAQPHLWEKCCVEHDLYLWAGGSRIDRNKTDKKLRSCVASTGATTHAKLIYFGVRLGSYSPIKFPGKLWSNGWTPRRKTSPLTLDEITTIEEFLKDNPPAILSSQDIEAFIAELKYRRLHQY